MINASSSAAINTDIVTIEICMRSLNIDKAAVFYKGFNGKISMTAASGLNLIRLFITIDVSLN